MDGLHGLMNSVTLKLLLSCPPLLSTATCGLTHRPRNTHHKVVHFNPPQLIPSFSPSKAHEINSGSWGILSGNKAGSWKALQLAGGHCSQLVDHLSTIQETAHKCSQFLSLLRCKEDAEEELVEFEVVPCLQSWNSSTKETHLRVLSSWWSYRSPSTRAVQTREGFCSNLNPRFRVQGILKIRSISRTQICGVFPGIRVFPGFRVWCIGGYWRASVTLGSWNVWLIQVLENLIIRCGIQTEIMGG